MNLAGSTAVGWYTLPNSKDYYFPAGQSASAEQLFIDCASQAQGTVNVPDFYGINLMFNDSLPRTFGGKQQATIGGVARVYGVTWISSLSGPDLSTVEHEMGHAYGWLHSTTPDAHDEYQNAWDIMSAAYNNCAIDDPIYGCGGKQTIADNRVSAGWIPAERQYTAGPSTHHIALDRTTLPPSTGYLVAIVPINGSSQKYLTIETL
ncbi:MAG: hypothetical protein R3C44_24395 [Chloroflexota bacterium]